MAGLDIAAEAVARAQFAARQYVGEIDGYGVILTAKVNDYGNPVTTVTAGEELHEEIDGFIHVTGESAKMRSDFHHISDAASHADELAEKHDLEPMGGEDE